MTGEGLEQATIRCVLARGGTSKGLYFHERDLPPAGTLRDRLLLRLMGSPDVLQIDGLGGSRPITSKVAIIAPSKRPDADVDYTFAQVEIDRALVIYDGNCGNISAGVGPFAVDEGIVPAVEGHTRVRIYNTNTKAIIVADVPVTANRARVEGNFAIPGVPGTGAEIAMNWSASVGAKTGRLLPTGNPVDTVPLASGKQLAVTFCDAGNPCIWVRASDVGIEGGELSQAIDSNVALLETLAEVRGKVLVALGMGSDWRLAASAAPGLIVGLVAPPATYTTLSDTEVSESDMDLRVRMIFMNRLHESIAGSGSICLAAASRVRGSVVEAVTRRSEAEILRIGHPSGITPARVEWHSIDTAPFVEFTYLGFSRTARRLMDSLAYFPRTTLSDAIVADHHAESSLPNNVAAISVP